MAAHPANKLPNTPILDIANVKTNPYSWSIIVTPGAKGITDQHNKADIKLIIGLMNNINLSAWVGIII